MAQHDHVISRRFVISLQMIKGAKMKKVHREELYDWKDTYVNKLEGVINILCQHTVPNTFQWEAFKRQAI